MRRWEAFAERNSLKLACFRDLISRASQAVEQREYVVHLGVNLK